jgi:phosphopantothenate---cysteine ligase (ATP)
LNALGKRVIVVLAAAVSDFYLPPDRTAEHKIQSRAGPLQLELSPVPKVVRTLRAIWCPSAYLVSFKLETDAALLESKVSTHTKSFAEGGNGVDACIGNILGHHHRTVKV